MYFVIPIFLWCLSWFALFVYYGTISSSWSTSRASLVKPNSTGIITQMERRLSGDSRVYWPPPIGKKKQSGVVARCLSRLQFLLQLRENESLVRRLRVGVDACISNAYMRWILYSARELAWCWQLTGRCTSIIWDYIYIMFYVPSDVDSLLYYTLRVRSRRDLPSIHCWHHKN